MESTKRPLFLGCGTAMITPMKRPEKPGGVPAVDADAFRALTRRQLEGGADALVVCGTTGESATLTDEEKAALISIAVTEARAAAGEGRTRVRVPVIAGTGSNNTARAAALSRMAESCGADGLLVVTPYYNKANADGLVSHYKAVTDAVSLPVIVYHVPSRTGCALSPETCRRLADNPQIAGLKDASGSISFTARTAVLCGDSLPIYAGNDDMILPTLALGGAGVVSVVSNLFPGRVSALCAAWRRGDARGARQAQLDLLPLCDVLFSDVNPIPVKAAMALSGLCEDVLRLPLCPAGPAVRERLAALLPKYGIMI